MVWRRRACGPGAWLVRGQKSRRCWKGKGLATVEVTGDIDQFFSKSDKMYQERGTWLLRTLNWVPRMDMSIKIGGNQPSMQSIIKSNTQGQDQNITPLSNNIGWGLKILLMLSTDIRNTHWGSEKLKWKLWTVNWPIPMGPSSLMLRGNNFKRVNKVQV